MKTMMIGLALTALAGAASRDFLAAQSGTATLSGTITIDEPSGGPVRRALVSLSFATDGATQRQTTTDEKGRFTFTNLPSGNARLIASKPAFITTYYGARRPGATFGVPVAIPEGRTTSITMRMPRGGVIAGTVFDEEGRPQSGVSVRVDRLVVSATGQRSLESYSNSALIPVTDDRGAYRIYGLSPGNFVVSAQPRSLGTGEIRQPTTAELQWAERAVAIGAGTGTAPAGDPPSPGRAVAFAQVYYPGTVNAASAGTVTVAPGQERTGIDLRMQLVTTARIDGTVTAADGRPAQSVIITLIPEVESSNQDAARAARLMEVGLVNGAGSAPVVRPDGSFAITGVEPGNYTLLARSGSAGRAGGAAGPAVDSHWAMTDIRVDGRDVSGIALRLAPGQRVSGRFVFESKSAANPVRATLSLRPIGNKGLSATNAAAAPGAPVDAFVVGGVVPAGYRLSATAAAGYTLKSIVVGGRDVTDAAVDIRPGEDLADVVITFTDLTTEVTGVLYDAAGQPTSDLSIVLFSTDRAMWFSGSRRVRPAVRPASDGRFTLSGLAPGEYFLAALTDVSASDLTSVSFLEQVAPAAVKVTVAAGEKKVQDLKIAGK